MASTLSLPRLELVRGLALRHPLLIPLLDLFSFEAVVALFVFAPRFKAHPIAQAIFPIDPTLVFLGLSAVIAPILILRRGVYMPGLVLFGGVMVFVFWLLITASWSPSRGFSREKFFTFIVIGVWTLFCTALIIAAERERVLRFLRIWVYLSAWLALEVFLVWAEQGYRGRVFLFGTETYLGYANVCGPAVLIMLAYWAAQRRALSVTAIGAMLLLLWLALPLVVGGGRGPLISTLIAMTVIVLLGLDTRDGRIAIYRVQLPVLIAAVATLAFVGWAVNSNLDVETIRRLSQLTGDNLGESAEDRMVQLGKAWRLITMQPILGWGIGSYGVLVFDRDENLYPHNLFIELMLEVGLIGMILYFLPWWVALRRISIRRVVEDRLFLCALLIFVQAFVALQTSFTYTENRNIMVGLGLMMVRSLTPEFATFRPWRLARRFRLPRMSQSARPRRTVSGTSRARRRPSGTAPRRPRPR